MKKTFTSFLFYFLFLIPVLAQNPSPSSTPKTVEKDDDIVKISTTLIQVDATVTDKNGKIVTDLKPEDFEIYENGKKQEITNFSSISNNSRLIFTAPSNSKENSIPFPVPIKSNQVKRTIVLMVDDLGLSFDSMHLIRRSLKKFVEEQMQPGDLVAVICTSGGSSALQQFTSDKRQLFAAIESIKWNIYGRKGTSSSASPSQAAKNDGAKISDEQIKRENEQAERMDKTREEIFSVGTLESVNAVVKGMSRLPGRKSIMLFSDGLAPIEGENDPDRGWRLAQPMKRLVETANRATVTIYSIDTRGLPFLGLTAADNTRDFTLLQLQQNLATGRFAALPNSRDGLNYLARATGGRYLFNNREITDSIDKALVDQTGFYLLGYQPSEEIFDPQKQQFNKLEVKLKRKDLNVRYRNGFYGIADKEINTDKATTPIEEITTALTSPFSADGIGLRLNTVFGNNEKNGSYLQSFLHIKTNDLKFSDESDGTHKASFEVLAVTFGAGGIPVDQVGTTYTIIVKDDAYKKFLVDGFVYSFIFPVKKAGAYQMRVAVRDSNTAKLGSVGQFIEVPDVDKERLASSGIILENLNKQEWKDYQASLISTENSFNQENNSMADTSLRQVKKGTVLRYGLEIYNARIDRAQKANLQTQVKLFRDDKQIFEGKVTPIDLQGQTNLKNIKFANALNLGNNMEAGDYMLQVIVTDNSAKEKYKETAQWVQFEVIN